MLDYIRLTGATVKGAKADLVNGVVRVTVDVQLTPEVLAARQTLAFMAYDKTAVVLTVSPAGGVQMPFEELKEAVKAVPSVDKVTLSYVNRETGEVLDEVEVRA